MKYLSVLVLAVILVMVAGVVPAGAAGIAPEVSPHVGYTYYVVRWGDTLANIAARFDTTVAALMRANHIRNPNFIYAGQALAIPARPAPVFNRVKVALIAVGDGNVGCGDGVVLVERRVAPTTAPLTAALRELLSLKQEYYGQSGLRNALHASNLAVQSVTLTNGNAVIRLTGKLSLGGECDDPRVQAQLEQTAYQFSTVHSVSIYLNGEPLQNVLGGKGL